MVLKVRAFEGNNEKLIPVSDIIGSVTIDRMVFDIPIDIVAETITLNFAPLLNSERVILNGLEMTEGASYDYTRTGNIITFNNNVLTQTGHVLVNYSY